MIRSRCASRLFSVWLQSNARPRYFTSISGRSSPANLLGGASGFLAGGGGSASVSGADSQVRALAALLRMPVRNLSAETVKKGEEEEEKKKSVDGDAKGIVSYWGIAPRKLVKPDGAEWKWTCFMPWDTYRSDTSIDLKKHHVPETFVDKVAYWTVKSLRWPSDLFFRKRYGCRAILLETIAAVPGMVGGMLLHFKSVRRFEHSGGWVKALLEEAENERMHLMTFMEVTKPKWYERALVISAQGVFCTAYFAAYVLSPKLAHRIVGYLEEEAIYSYTEFLNELDKGRIENVPAPAIAIDYWQLPQNATLRDVVMVVRADEAHHRDVNHFASDIHHHGLQLKETPAPVGYH